MSQRDLLETAEERMGFDLLVAAHVPSDRAAAMMISAQLEWEAGATSRNPWQFARHFLELRAQLS